MESILSKDYFLDWLRNYGTTILTAAAFVTLLVMPERSMPVAVFGLAIMYFWVYMFHRCLHFLPTEGPFRYINTHWIFHHQPLKILDRRVELLLESFNDFGMAISVLLLQWFTGVWIVPTSIILFYGIWYTSVHIINYSVIGSPIHKDHHKNVGTNFGPDVLDHFFGTNHTSEKEDLINMMPNAVVALAAVWILKQSFHWVD